MTISAVADSAATPPSVEIAVSVPSGAVMRAVSLFRLESGVRVPVREQPSAGFDSRLVSDFEAPYGVPVTYSWDVTYTGAASIEAVWAEAWGSLADWVQVGAHWSVSGGRVVWSGGDDPNATLTRAVAAGKYRVVFDAVPVGVQTIQFGGFYIDVAASRMVVGSFSTLFDAGTGAWTLTVSDTAVSLTTSAGTYSVQGDVELTQIQFAGAVSQIKVGSQWAYPIGSGAGQFGSNSTVHFAADNAGNLFMTDPINGRVNVYGAGGVFVTSFGTPGSGNGQFSSMEAIAVDASGNVFVGDGSRIQKFVPSGGTWVYSAKVGSYGAGDAQFHHVWALATDATGRVYATDGSLNRLQRFTNNLVYVDKVGSTGVTSGKFNRASSVAVDSAGSIFVADETRVQRFTSALVPDGVLAPQGTAQGSVYRPISVAASMGVIFTLSASSVIGANANSVLQKFTPAGAFLGSVASGLLSDGLGENDLWVAASSSGVFVRDAFQHSVTTFAQPALDIRALGLSSFEDTATITETSAPVILDPVNAWLIHPGKPGLSVSLSATDPWHAGIRTIASVKRASTATVHEILGSSQPVVTSSGPRGSDVTGMTIYTATADEERQMNTLLNDQTPILINIPQSWDLGFRGGFYAVGEVESRRFLTEGGFPQRDHYLPLVEVESPVITVESSGWSFAALALEFESFDAVLAEFASFADLTANIR